MKWLAMQLMGLEKGRKGKRGQSLTKIWRVEITVYAEYDSGDGQLIPGIYLYMYEKNINYYYKRNQHLFSSSFFAYILGY